MPRTVGAGRDADGCGGGGRRGEGGKRRRQGGIEGHGPADDFDLDEEVEEEMGEVDKQEEQEQES